jgi:hypothetical protein
MINYIGDNLEDYIVSVYLGLETNTDEPIEHYLRLLNDENIDKDLKEKIIIQVNTKITDINAISDVSQWNTLFKYSKVSPSWNNILASFESEENSMAGDLITFLNNIPNAEQLSKTKMTTKVNDKNIFSGLCRTIIVQNELTDESYNLITKSIPWCYNDLNFSNLTADRIIILIKNGVINPTIQSFNELKRNHKGLNIKLLVKYPEKYIEKINELEFDSDDIILILESSVLSISNKKVFYESCDEEIINSNDKILLLLSNYIAQNTNFNYKTSTKRKILLSTVIAKDRRIELFIQNIVPIDQDLINSFMNTLGNEYYEITFRDRKATLKDNPLNRQFLEKLIATQYISSFSKTKKGLRVNHKRK